MLYKIIFDYKDPENGQKYTLTGIKEGLTPGEAAYYFRSQYPASDIEILETSEIIL